MKNILKLFFLVFVLSFSSNLIFSQAYSFYKRSQVHAIGDYDGQVVRIRIAPANYETWDYGNKNGYKIERLTIISNGDTLSLEKSRESRKILIDGIKPPPNEEEWDNIVKDTGDLVNVAKAMIYGDSFKVMDVNALDLQRAYNIDSEQENRFSFSLFAAEQSFNTAVSMGLGFVDENVEPNCSYYYYIIPSGMEGYENSMQKGYFKINTFASSHNEVPTNLEVIPGDKVMYLSWNQPVSGNNYSSFDLERSEDGENFIKVNPFPIVPGSLDGNNKTIYFTDTVPENGIKYYYRINGKNSFGNKSDYTSIKLGIGETSAIETGTIVDTIMEETKGKLTLKWKSQMNQDKISGYNIYRSSKVDGEMQKINSTPLPANNTSLIDENPDPSNYYIIETLDENGKATSSIPYLGQPDDNTPPAPPVGIKGICNKKGVITLNWRPSIASDCDGYRIYTANNLTSEFSIIGTTSDTFFTYNIDLKTLSKKIIFKLKSEDRRDNYSDYSEIVEVRIPDIVPPEFANILEAKPIGKQIKIKWKLSKSDDVSLYVLLRNSSGSSKWDSVYTMPQKELEYFEFFDTKVEILKKYSYKVKVSDFDGNSSESSVVSVSLNDSGERGKITNFNINLYTNNNTVGAIDQVTEIKRNDKKFANVKLVWDYNFAEDLKGFTVYRSEGNEPFRLYKFYTLMDLFGVKSWNEIPMNNGLVHCEAIDYEARKLKSYKYKIEAKHDYGGYSLSSPIKYLNTVGSGSDNGSGVQH